MRAADTPRELETQSARTLPRGRTPDELPSVSQQAQMLQLQRLVGNRRLLTALQQAPAEAGEVVAAVSVQRGRLTRAEKTKTLDGGVRKPSRPRTRTPATVTPPAGLAATRSRRYAKRVEAQKQTSLREGLRPLKGAGDVLEGTVEALEVPTVDRFGIEIWHGKRDGLRFSKETKEVMDARRAEHPLCAITENCERPAESIDHVRDFATVQAELEQFEVCTGTHHYEAVLLKDAEDAYNHVPNLKWACKTCNSSKGGAKGLYENVPKLLGKCPGKNCEVAPQARVGGAEVGPQTRLGGTEVDEKGAGVSDDSVEEGGGVSAGDRLDPMDWSASQ